MSHSTSHSSDLIPLQASRVTRAGARLKKVGMEVRSRPYSYIDTPQLDLDSLVLYTTSLRMSVSSLSLSLSLSSFFTNSLSLYLSLSLGNIAKFNKTLLKMGVNSV